MTNIILSDTIPVAVQHQHNFTLSQISDLLCCALEGGSNYWYSIERFVKPTGDMFRSNLDTEFRHLDYPLSPGGALIIVDSDGDMDPATLNLESIQRGLQIMAEKYPRHMTDFIQDNCDADTGDVFLQCACYGDVVFS